MSAGKHLLERRPTLCGPRTAAVLAVLLCLSVSPPGSAADGGKGPVRRLVSLVPSVTEVLFSLEAADTLVGVSDYCNYPPEASLLPRVGGRLNPNLEVIVSLRPDLVLTFAGGGELERRLKALSVESKAFRLDTLAEIRQSILALGTLTGRQARAEALTAGLDRKIEETTARIGSKPKVTVMLVLSRNPGSLGGIFAVGPGSYLNELVEIAGGANVLADARMQYPRVTFEEVLSRDPAVIIDTSLMGTQEGSRTEKALKEWRNLPSLQAVRNNRTHIITDPAFTIPGSRLPRTLDKLARILHPEAFEDR